MVDQASNQQDPRAITLSQLVADWLKVTRPDVENWRIETNWMGESTMLDAYGWWFSIYNDYMTSGVGITVDGKRYNTGFLIDATDPEFFNKLQAKLDEIAATWPARKADLLAFAKNAVDRSS